MSNDYILEKGEAVVRVYDEQFKSNQFNNSGLGSRRFDPFEFQGSSVGSLYFALHSIDAFAETIMRKNSTGGRSFNSADIDAKKLSTLITTRRLKFIDLEQIDSIKEHLHKGPESYAFLRNFAKILLKRLGDDSEVVGFTWYGVQRSLPGMRCFVCYDSLSSPVDFKETSDSYLLSEPCRVKLQDAAVSLDCQIPERFIHQL
ncbi:conserved hypothetical protein [Vibrio nigripulchritudo SOn1]|uniref:RES domain-containing protein n=1 Tax=Vibrio nigripulchritudo SOn1 TaxID=1238450 RepID=A0AAV2VZQ0_9VIBR|nr:hypothetical protein [Vibrio nigripulchritudo]CCO50249.1 conserved hypothetical protein [Vibrio nigripulchritudo SOn1]